MAFININGNKTHVVDLNPTGKQTIIMIHGLFASLSVFYMTIAPKLAERYRVVLYDLNGHGLSARTDRGFYPENLMEDLLALMRELNIAEASLLGYCYGGLIVLCLALRHPDKIKSLALIDVPPLDVPWLDEPEFDYSVLSEANFESILRAQMQALGIIIPEALEQKALSRWVDLYGNGIIQKAVKDAQQKLVEAPPELLDKPVLLIYGNESAYLNTGYLLEKRIRGAQLKIGQGDHNMLILDVAFVIEQLESFL